MSTIVCKFGGSSLATAERIRAAADIIRSDERRRHIVVSAPGARATRDIKVTDLLRSSILNRRCGEPFIAELVAIPMRFGEIANNLGIRFDTDEASDTLREALEAERYAFVESRGEYWMARIMAEFLGREFIDAAEIVKFQHGSLHWDLTHDLIGERLKGLDGCVIGGYYGSALGNSSEIILLSRGGSDVTASLVAHGIHAELYENWTDVPGVLSADPRVVEHARTIRQLTHRELREMAAAGAGVMHPLAIKPVLQAGIPISIRNTFEPSGLRTTVDVSVSHRRGTVVSVVGSKGFHAITLSDTGAYESHEFLVRVSGVLHELRVPVRHMSDGFDDVTFLVDAAPDRTEAVQQRLAASMPDIEFEWRRAARVALIGEGMTGVPGFMGRVTTLLGQNGINIIAPSQSAKERSMVFAIPEDALELAIRALHDEFVE